MSKMSRFSLKNLWDWKSKKKRPSERELAAYHEAGHVVLSVACKWPVKSVTIAPKKLEGDDPHFQKADAAARSLKITFVSLVSLGFTDVRFGGGELSDLREDKLRFLRWSLSGLGGPIAEGDRLGDEDLTQAQSLDLMVYRQHCEQIFGSTLPGEQLGEQLIELIELTNMMVVYYRPQITAVAQALLKKETLSESEIDDLLATMPRLDLTSEAEKLRVTP